MLSELQQEIVAIVVDSTSDQQFALAGGAALILKGLVDRQTRDLDFFAREPEAVDRVVESVDDALRAAGMSTRRLIEASGFVRIEVSRGGEVCERDLGVDARIRREEPTPFGSVLATEELAADKTLALFGRAAARDFIDVYVLSRRFGEEQLCTLAAEKDAGFDRGHLADALRSFHRLDRDLFDVDDETYARIDRWTQIWANDLAQALARERVERQGPERTIDNGPDLPDM